MEDETEMGRLIDEIDVVRQQAAILNSIVNLGLAHKRNTLSSNMAGANSTAVIDLGASKITNTDETKSEASTMPYGILMKNKGHHHQRVRL